jgi:hypothetical protein
MSAIAPSQRDYVFTIAHPNCIYNSLLAIQEGLANKPDADAHVHIMFEYDLDYVCPSTRFTYIIDDILESRAINWRVHSYHVNPGTLKVRVILRKVSLVDLTLEKTVLHDYEKRMHDLMQRYSEQFCDGGPVFGSSNIAIFKLPNDKGYYYLFTRVFDMWEYSEEYPTIGWRPLEESEIHD